jgi:hypothetical protein
MVIQHPESSIKHRGGSPWPALESSRGLLSVPACWRARLGEHYDAFRSAFLTQSSQPAKYYPCPRGCGCMHEILNVGDDVRRLHLSNNFKLESPHVVSYNDKEPPSTCNLQPATCNEHATRNTPLSSPLVAAPTLTAPTSPSLPPMPSFSN